VTASHHCPPKPSLAHSVRFAEGLNGTLNVCVKDWIGVPAAVYRFSVIGIEKLEPGVVVQATVELGFDAQFSHAQSFNITVTDFTAAVVGARLI
jgi:hypothetical protein